MIHNHDLSCNFPPFILHTSSHQSTGVVVLLESREHKVHHHSEDGIDSLLFYPGTSAA